MGLVLTRRAHRELVALREESIGRMLDQCKETKLLKRNLERLNRKIEKFNTEVAQQELSGLKMYVEC